MLSSLLFIPLLGVFLISSTVNYEFKGNKNLYPKIIVFVISIINFFISLIIYIIFDFSTNQYQFVQQQYEMTFFDLYLGVDGISIYFILLTTIIMPIALLSN
jgi:NADH:ubiquinone oxidoreductase subunit 4 (subunit M)